MHFLYGSSGGIGGDHAGAGVTFGSGNSAIERQLMLQLQACIKDNPDFTKELVRARHSMNGSTVRDYAAALAVVDVHWYSFLQRGNWAQL